MSWLAEYQAGQREEQCKGEGRGEEKAAGAQQLWGKAPGTNQEQQQAVSALVRMGVCATKQCPPLRGLCLFAGQH